MTDIQKIDPTNALDYLTEHLTEGMYQPLRKPLYAPIFDWEVSPFPYRDDTYAVITGTYGGSHIRTSPIIGISCRMFPRPVEDGVEYEPMILVETENSLYPLAGDPKTSALIPAYDPETVGVTTSPTAMWNNIVVTLLHNVRTAKKHGRIR